MIRFLFVFLLFGLVACDMDVNSETKSENQEPMKVKKESTGFIHTVFFWMVEDMSDEDKKYFESELEALGKTPSIQSYYWGKAAGTPREVVDNSYDYAWIVHFKDAVAQDAYQVDPIHKKFVENCEKFFERVQVYDTILK